MKKIGTTIIAVFVFLAITVAAFATVTPTVLLNGGINQICRLEFTAATTLSIGLSTGESVPADWWLLCSAPDGTWKYFNLASGTWVNGVVVTYQGNLCPFGQAAIPMTGLDFSKLGTYNFYFAIDKCVDGKITTDNIASCAKLQVVNDCLIRSITQLGDYGFVGDFKIVLDYSTLPAGTMFLKGQRGPNDAWIDYAVDSSGTVHVQWPNGKLFEFSYGTTSGGVETWIDPSCSVYKFPPAATGGNLHLGITLGTEHVCPGGNTGDPIITRIDNLGGDLHRVYLNFSNLPIQNYKALGVFGSSAPNRAWVEYIVVDAFPCFYFDLHYTGLFEFSFYVVEQNGSTTQWVDPTLSTKFLYKDHLAINF